ncbi:hypothetical protein MKW94_023737 [Papaver nudicaule]|uniref:Proteasome assembly chaperone 4 n=1 Tax=Papaver nudicaule TaxID=74823 RepID=A0AA41W299_PAPNU|nr:hypothetical protein [Papaver nudicaule]
MASEELNGGALNFEALKLKETATGSDQSTVRGSDADAVEEDGVKITCFTEDMNNTTFHIQIIKLQKQIYAWIGCNSAKLGHVYAAAPTRPNNTVSVTSILGGASDNTGSSIARRLALRCGLNIILACNIPKNSPLLEADAEKILIKKLISLGYTRPKTSPPASMVASAR